MDYDRNDALLHYLFRETQGDAWFRPNESTISSGIALRVSDGGPNDQEPEFRIFPYETPSLLPFEEAVRQLNPAVAVKIRSASVHAAMAQALAAPSNSSTPSDTPGPSGTGTTPDASTVTSIYIDADHRIQIIDTMLLLPIAERDQCAAFIRDERVLVVWADELDRIIPMCQDFEDRLIKLLWRENLKLGPAGAGAGRTSPSLLPSTPGVSSSNGKSASRRSSFDGSAEGLASSISHSSLHGPTIHGGISRTSAPPSSWVPPKASTSAAGGHTRQKSINRDGSRLRSEIRPGSSTSNVPGAPRSNSATGSSPLNNKTEGRTWYGKRYFVPSPPQGSDDPQGDSQSVSAEDLEKALKENGGKWKEVRKVALYAPFYNGLAAAVSLVIIGNGVRTLLKEYFLDGNVIRFALLATAPFLFSVSLFFSLQMVQNVAMVFGPIEQYHENSCYYSGAKPPPNRDVDDRLPHITIQMPVYKEGLEGVLAPSVSSIKRAMQTYARQGGTSSIFINDDGLRVLPAEEREKRISFYKQHGIAWVARPGHGDMGEVDEEEDVDEKGKGKQREGDPEKGVKKTGKPFHRAGRFKKASNLNYGLTLSLKMERHLQRLIKEEEEKEAKEAAQEKRASRGSATQIGEAARPSAYGHSRVGSSSVDGHTSRNSGPIQPQPYRASYTPYPGPPSNPPTSPSTPAPLPPSLEDQALQLAISEMYEESGSLHRPWASNARNARIGDIILLVDSDTIVPEDCLRDAAREMGEDERVGIVQHESDVLKVAGHYFENGIAYFTRRINRCISVACANGEIAPFMGHNAFLRWKAIQDVAFIDTEDGKEKIWSETNVSEDFDMALRLMQKGYIIRWATYSKGGFKEGVSLSVDDELNRWQKYSYGCSELLFNPLSQWWRKGPISKSIRHFVWSSVPIHYKISSLSYMFSYYGIAAGVTIAIINYILLGFQFEVDGYYLHSFEIWLATTVVFFGSGTVGYSVLQYRLGLESFIPAFLETLMWVPFFFFFFGGLSIPLSQAMLAHLFSYNITWSATIKEVERSNFFKEIPKIFKRFWFPLSFSFVLIVGMIIVATPLVPIEWRVDGSGWAVIFPVALLSGCHILFPIVLNPWLMVFSY